MSSRHTVYGGKTFFLVSVPWMGNMKMVFCYQNCSDLLWEKTFEIRYVNFHACPLEGEGVKIGQIFVHVVVEWPPKAMDSTFPFLVVQFEFQVPFRKMEINKSSSNLQQGKGKCI